MASAEEEKKNEEMKQDVALGDYAYITVKLNMNDGKSGITMYKKPYNSDKYGSAFLDCHEWEELSNRISELARVAADIDPINGSGGGGGSGKGGGSSSSGGSGGSDAVAADDSNSQPSYPTQLLSTRMMVKINLFAAPNGVSYVTMAVRPYVVDTKTNQLKMLREGITLNLREIQLLSEKAGLISAIVEEQMASTHFVWLSTIKDCQFTQKTIENFFTKASPGQKLRLIVEKRESHAISPAVAGVMTQERRRDPSDGVAVDSLLSGLASTSSESASGPYMDC